MGKLIDILIIVPYAITKCYKWFIAHYIILCYSHTVCLDFFDTSFLTAIQCPMCPVRLVYIPEHLRDAHSMLNLEQRVIVTKYARRRVKLANVACPLCGKVVKYP